MKQTLKDGDEYDLKSSWRKKGWITRKAGGWKKIKQRLNKRFRKEGKQEIKNERFEK